MVHIDNDRWRAHIPLTRNGRYEYVVQAWRDLFASWRDEAAKKHNAGQDVTLELIEGHHLVEAAAEAAETGNVGAFQQAIAPVKAAANNERSAEGRAGQGSVGKCSSGWARDCSSIKRSKKKKRNVTLYT